MPSTTQTEGVQAAVSIIAAPLRTYGLSRHSSISESTSPQHIGSRMAFFAQEFQVFHAVIGTLAVYMMNLQKSYSFAFDATSLIPIPDFVSKFGNVGSIFVKVYSSAFAVMKMATSPNGIISPDTKAHFAAIAYDLYSCRTSLTLRHLCQHGNPKFSHTSERAKAALATLIDFDEQTALPTLLTNIINHSMYPISSRGLSIGSSGHAILPFFTYSNINTKQELA